MLRPEEICSAQFVDSFFPAIDGVMQVVDNYAALMNRVSYSCVVCPSAKGGFDDSTLSYDVFRTQAIQIPGWSYTVPMPYRRMAAKRVESIEKLNILHAHSPFTQTKCALYLAKVRHIPLISTFHTKYYDDVFDISHSNTLAKAVTDYIVNFYNRCDDVWACSDGAADTLKSYGYKKEIFVMPNGTSYKMPDDPGSVAQKAREQLGIKKDNIKNLLFVGNVKWQKNLKLALDTMKIICAKGGGYRLYIAGKGVNEARIKEYTCKLGLKEYVTFLGQIRNTDLLSGVFLNADLFFFPSVYDTSAIVLREASAMKVPSLLVEGSCAAGVITPDENGFTAKEDPVAMAKKIESIFKDEEKLRSVGENAAATIPISWEEMIPKVYERYAEVIDRYKSR